jgi:hypothetical protein
MSLGVTSTLAPALSPRKGSAENGLEQSEFSSTLGMTTCAEKDMTTCFAAVALPLPGERAGVRAEQSFAV